MFHRSRRRLSLEKLESRSMLAGDIQFADPLTVRGNAGAVGVGSIHAVDVNGDAVHKSGPETWRLKIKEAFA